MSAFNPFRREYTDRQGAPVVDNLRLGDRQERAISTSGEINASSKIDDLLLRVEKLSSIKTSQNPLY